MLYLLLYPLHNIFSFLNVFRYISFRAIYAIVTSLAISLLLGSYTIRKLGSLSIREFVRSDGPPSHYNKKGTPTMGGLLILFALTTSVILWGDLRNYYLWIILFSTLSLGVIGLIDDYRKISRQDCKGLSIKLRLGTEFIIGLLIALSLYFYPSFSTRLNLPFFKTTVLNMGIFYIPFAMLVIVGSANAVNLADGLDGLATGLILVVSGTYLLFTYFTGNFKFASYLQIPFIVGSGELTVFLGAIIGGCIGFLWYNSYPAQIFMGDVGSLALGGALGTIAIVSKQELLLALIGGLFVIEALSVIFQVGSFKFWQKRIFKMAPIHHHFELEGWAEPKIVVRFWIIAIILALIALSTLKIR